MRTISIKSGRIGRYDDVSPFLVESGALELKFELPEVSGEFFFITELNGISEKKFIPRGGVIALTNLCAGELCAEVKHYLRGTLIKTYKVEPLILKEIDGSLSGTPEIERLRAENAELCDKLSALERTLEAEKKEAETARHERDKAFLAFAYAEYENSPLLNGRGLSLEEFAAALGYSAEAFAEKEITEIKNIKEKL